MNSKVTEKFLGTGYNPWNIYINDIYPYKNNLGKVQYLFLFDNAFYTIKFIK